MDKPRDNMGTKFKMGDRVVVSRESSPGLTGTVTEAEGDFCHIDFDDQKQGNRWIATQVLELIPSEEKDEPVSDAVEHPSHYNTGLMIHSECGKPIEVIDTIEHLSGNLFNVCKYIQRAGHKGSDKTIEDLEKGLWYLQREIQRMKRETARMDEEEGKL